MSLPAKQAGTMGVLSGSALTFTNMSLRAAADGFAGEISMPGFTFLNDLDWFSHFLGQTAARAAAEE